MRTLLTPLAEYVWQTRYRAATPEGVEQSIEDTWHRVACAAAAVDPEPELYSKRFGELLADFQFIPGGRILAGAGTARAVTLANCFVMGPIEDSVTGIFETLKEAALTMQQGGGVGYDFSALRPRGTPAISTGGIATGPVSFLKVFDSACATVMSSGARRGAMMATLRCDHPDVLEFVAAKRALHDLPHFNLSLLVTDAFMGAVAEGAPWPLRFPAGSAPQKTIPARELWDAICQSAHASGEPGMLFIDRINRTNNLAYRETLSATNPCGEAPLPEYGACHLGSLNLVRFVRDPFTPGAHLDYVALDSAARLAVRFLDDIVDASRYPLFRQAQRAHATRRIGIGITGLGDALAMLRLHYASVDARSTAARVMTTIRDSTYAASIDLARERGAFPDLDLAKHLERPFIQHLPETLQTALARHGVRNSHLLAIAPAGTISLLANNVSSGIEPIFALEIVRRVLGPDGSARSFTADDYAYRLWRARHGAPCALPEWFSDARAIAPHEHLAMQAEVQARVDGAISKTILLERSATIADIAKIFRDAHALGLKGCTVYRLGTREDVFVERNNPSLETEIDRSAHCAEPHREVD